MPPIIEKDKQKEAPFRTMEICPTAIVKSVNTAQVLGACTLKKF